MAPPEPAPDLRRLAGSRLRALRLARGESAGRFAARIGVHPRRLWGLEAGDLALDSQELRRAADALAVPAHLLFRPPGVLITLLCDRGSSTGGPEVARWARELRADIALLDDYADGLPG